MTSLVLMIITFSMNAFSAPVHSQSLPPSQQLMKVQLPLEILKSTMRQDTTAKCLAHSTAPSVPLSSDYHQIAGQMIALNLSFATCFSRILMQFFIIMWSNTPYPLANPSCSQVTVLPWQEYLPASQFFWSVPTPAPHTSLTWCGARTMMRALLLVDHAVISLSSVGICLPYPRLQSTQSTSRWQTPAYPSWPPNCKDANVFPPPSKP